MDKDIFEDINKIQNYSPQKFCVALVGDKTFQWEGRTAFGPLGERQGGLQLTLLGFHHPLPTAKQST